MLKLFGVCVVAGALLACSEGATGSDGQDVVEFDGAVAAGGAEAGGASSGGSAGGALEGSGGATSSGGSSSGGSSAGGELGAGGTEEASGGAQDAGAGGDAQEVDAGAGGALDGGAAGGASTADAGDAAPEATPGCECSTGECCDGCHFRDFGYLCGSYVSASECTGNTSDACPSNSARVRRDYRRRFCSGTSAACDGHTARWQSVDELCPKGSFCVDENPGTNTATCGACPD